MINVIVTTTMVAKWWNTAVECIYSSETDVFDDGGVSNSSGPPVGQCLNEVLIGYRNGEAAEKHNIL